jgi:aspartyl-tRNA(Asn)/glutamyl-tRNA(Gln) amidotransferase subunit A
MPLSWTLDKLGPFGRSAEDCGLILQTIAGRDRKDAGSAGKSFYTSAVTPLTPNLVSSSSS